MDRTEQKSIIEGLLFVSGDEGISPEQIAKVLEIEGNEVIDILEEMQKECEGAHEVCKLYSMQKYIVLLQRKNMRRTIKTNRYPNSCFTLSGCARNVSNCCISSTHYKN